MDKQTTHLQIGVITRPHGLRGEMRVHLHNEDSDALEHVTHLVIEGAKGQATRHEIKSVRGSNKGPILALATVQDMDGANAMRGAKLWIERTAVPALAPGEYYLVDVIGCDVIFEGQIFAKVKDVRPDPSVDTLVLSLRSGGSAELPIVDAWVGSVDTEKRTVQLLSTDGVIEA